VPWRDARVDMGLTFGRKPLIEPFVGVLGYIMGLPMLVIGITLTLVLIAFYTAASGGAGGPLAPQGGPAHPIVDQLAGAGVWPIVQIFLVAAVAAPIVEEIMFRGVLYRHLRSATSGEGVVLSVLISTVINTFLFAVIHPQGFLAVPALMSLAVALTLVREWRGTIVPSIVIHAISNGLVMSLLVFIIGSASA
jgi:membrane protease YdiL (CAAX protease family)